VSASTSPGKSSSRTAERLGVQPPQELLRDNGNGRFEVRPLNNSVFNRRLNVGALYLAAWDGTDWHRITGRPMFNVVRRLREPGKARSA
jgi:hypothetical protein